MLGEPPVGLYEVFFQKKAVGINLSKGLEVYCSIKEPRVHPVTWT
jgi:hypothetical protein